MVAQGQGERGMGSDCQWVHALFWDEKFLKLGSVVDAKTCECTGNHSVVNFSWLYVVIYGLYLSEAF